MISNESETTQKRVEEEANSSSQPKLISLNLKRKRNRSANRVEEFNKFESEISTLLTKLQNQTAVVKNISIMPSTERESNKGESSNTFNLIQEDFEDPQFKIITLQNLNNKEKDTSQIKNTRYAPMDFNIGTGNEMKKESLLNNDSINPSQQVKKEDKLPEAAIDDEQKNYSIEDVEELLDDKHQYKEEIHEKPVLKSKPKAKEESKANQFNYYNMKGLNELIENKDSLNENKDQYNTHRTESNLQKKETGQFDFDVNDIAENVSIPQQESKKGSEFEFDVQEIDQKGPEEEKAIIESQIKKDNAQQKSKIDEDNAGIVTKSKQMSNKNEIREEDNDGDHEDNNDFDFNNNKSKAFKTKMASPPSPERKNIQNSSIEEIGYDDNKEDNIVKEDSIKNSDANVLKGSNKLKSIKASTNTNKNEKEEMNAPRQSEGEGEGEVGFSPEIKELDSNNDEGNDSNDQQNQSKEKEIKPQSIVKEEPSSSGISNRKEDKNIVTDLTSKLTSIINKINDYDFNHPNLNKKCEFIDKFIEEEQTLINAIPNFKEEIIKPEGNSVFLKRRQGYLTKKHIDSTFIINNILLEQLQNCKVLYKTKIENNYELSKPDLSAPSKKELSRIKESIAASTTASVGRIENIESFCHKYNASKSTQFMQKIINSFNYWRSVTSDGNSLYRVFMLGLLEDYIFNKKVKELSMLTNEIMTRAKQEPSSPIFKRQKIKIDSSVILLKGIINYLKENKIKSAYALLYEGYCLNDNSFDYTLIAYLRSVVLEYLKESYDLLENEASKNNQHINPDEKDNIDSIGYFGIEGSFFTLCVCSFLYNVNITFVWIDGELMKPRTNIMKIEDPESLDLPLITVGYAFSHYFKIYPIEINKTLNEIISKIPNEDIGIKQLVFIQKDKKELIDCSSCKKKSPKVYFLQKNFSACLECIIAHIDELLAQRAMTFALANFVSLEYYTNDIPIGGGYSISEYEYIELFEDVNITDALYQKIQLLCFTCGKFYSKAEIVVLSCNCYSCIDCLKQKTENTKHGFKVLNKYEKFKFEKVKCECNNALDLEEANKLLNAITQDDITKAKERMKQYITTLCMGCERKLGSNEKQKKGEEIPFRKMHIVKENDKNPGIDYSNEIHLLCQECITKEKKKEKAVVMTEENNNNQESEGSIAKTGKNNNKGTQTKMLFCKLCRKKHFIEGKDWGIKEEKICCNTNCNII